MIVISSFLAPDKLLYNSWNLRFYLEIKSLFWGHPTVLVILICLYSRLIPFKNSMSMNLIFQIWYELIYRKCYFHKLSTLKRNPKNMFASLAAVSYILLLHYVFRFCFVLFFHMNNCQALLNKLNGDAYRLESRTGS